MDIHKVIGFLSKNRKVFHSEADFQFALAWEIKNIYPDSTIRLEVPTGTKIKGRIDIVTRCDKAVYPIELKYLKKKLICTYAEEQYNLAEGTHDIDMYGCMKDISRIETFREQLNGFRAGYSIWLTNDRAYWESNYNSSYYKEFHAPDGSKKSGTMQFKDGAKILSLKGYESPIILNDSYHVKWKEYSDLGITNGQFKYAIISVKQ